ncbi:septum formation initiator family protein [Streptomyces sp. NPDC006552]|uniref:septum formation initiator family protein n=1 Tax=Streptomyces sp. NPDC006552 TaxID=3157179 RepID=UPI0033B479DD
MTARSGSKDSRNAGGSPGAKGSGRPRTSGAKAPAAGGAPGPKKSARGPGAPAGGRAARLARIFPVAPGGGAQAARAPFVLLVVLLLGGGLITLLLLNSSLNEGSFKLSKLKKQTTELTDDEQQLQRDVDSYSAPDSLERRARELGMVTGGDPAFLGPDGTVRGVPKPAALTAPAYRPVPPPETLATFPDPPRPAAAPPSAAVPTPSPAQPAPAPPVASAPSNPGR